MLNKEELSQQYEDAALALILNEYAEQKGNRLLQEFEDGRENELPTEDAKFRKLIEKSFSQARRRESFFCFFRTTCRVAAMLFFVLGVCVALTFSVAALRPQVAQFVLDSYDRYSIFYFQGKTDVPKIPLTDDDAAVKYTMDQLVPQGYEPMQYHVLGSGRFIYLYINEDGESILFNSFTEGASPRIDTEDAKVSSVSLREHQAYLIEKDGRTSILWHQEDQETVYYLSCGHLDKNQAWKLACVLAKVIDTGALVHPDEPYNNTPEWDVN